MFEKFFPVKLGEQVLRAGRPRIANEAWHADPRDELSRVINECNAVPKRLSRFRKLIDRLPAAPGTPRPPTAMPPTTSARQSSIGRNRMDERLRADARGTK